MIPLPVLANDMHEMTSLVRHSVSLSTSRLSRMAASRCAIETRRSKYEHSDDEICKAIKSLVEGDETWADIMKRLPVFEGQEID